MVSHLALEILRRLGANQTANRIVEVLRRGTFGLDLQLHQPEDITGTPGHACAAGLHPGPQRLEALVPSQIRQLRLECPDTSLAVGLVVDELGEIALGIELTYFEVATVIEMTGHLISGRTGWTQRG